MPKQIRDSEPHRTDPKIYIFELLRLSEKIQKYEVYSFVNFLCAPRVIGKLLYLLIFFRPMAMVMMENLTNRIS